MIPPLWVVGLCGLGGLGLVLVRSSSRLGRWLAWAVMLAAGLGVVLPPAVVVTDVVPTGQRLVVDGPTPGPTLLAGLAQAAPRAVDVELVAAAALPELPPGPAGAIARSLVPPLPLPPEAVQAVLVRGAEVGRPAALEVTLAGVAGSFASTVSVHGPDGLAATLAGDLAVDRPLQLPFLATAAGEATVDVVLRTTDGGGELRRTGTFAITAPAPVVVLDPAGVVAAALRAQGLPVDARQTLPTDLGACAGVVVGQPLPIAEQERLAAAVGDGLGVFLFGAACPAGPAPLGEVLPLEVLPPPVDGPGAAAGGPVEPGPTTPPSAVEPPAAPPPSPSPPAGQPGPVSSEPVEVDKHAMAMVLVVDRSGSMGETVDGLRTKMDYAKASAWQTAQQLQAGDAVAVVTFGNQGQGRVVLPLTDVAAEATIRAGIEGLSHAHEWTYLLAGLQAAERLLQDSRAAVKHVVVITDGAFDVGESLALRALAFRLRTERKATLSILSLVAGRGAQQFQADATRIAAEGGGVFVAEDDPSRVPVFVSAEVTRSLSKLQRRPREPGRGGKAPTATPPSPPPPTEPPPPVEPPPAPAPPPATALPVVAVAASRLLEPPPAGDGWPALAAAPASRARFDATVLLVAGEAGWPLLAFGNRGLGRVGVFTAELGGPAAAAFRAEPAFPGRLAGWVQHVLRPAVEPVAQALLQRSERLPSVPSPAEAAALAALAGAPMVVGAASAPAAPPLPHRAFVAATADHALALAGLLLVLALAERWLGRRALARGEPTR